MLDPRFVAENIETVQKALGRRSAEAAANLEAVAEVANRRRKLVQETETKQAARNLANQAMASLAKGGDPAEFAAKREQLKTLSGEVKELESKLSELEAELQQRLMLIPNLPHETTPNGKGEADNVTVRVWGEAPKFAFPAKTHDELGTSLGIMDFERAAKLSGARFSVLLGAAARLERALGQYMLDLHADKHGYTEVIPPYLVKASALEGTGQLPKFESDLFKTYRDANAEDKSALYLVPTAEVPVTNLHADEILDGSELPKAYCSFTPCFRSEAGSYGRDVRGLVRQHQFHKVELVRFVKPEDSLSQLQLLLGHAEAVLQGLGLHYRVVELCAADLGFSAMKCFDIEVWLPGQNAFREISSCSTFGDFQARRAKIRYRADAKAKPQFLHTLNGSGLAVGRTLVAVLEQYQQADGSVLVPPALQSYMGGLERVTKA
ncbi:MAG TPA: serine--tRNA ligase [Polyangiaceae bacterium]|jgi:seryl-tRNA synthetase|nr:serine--tRNA ligase [Polyangiaceae bacterium]